MTSSIKSSDIASTSQALTQALEQQNVPKQVAEVLGPTVALLEVLAQASSASSSSSQDATGGSLDTSDGSDTSGTSGSSSDAIGSLATQLGTEVGNWISNLMGGGSTQDTSGYGDVNGGSQGSSTTSGDGNDTSGTGDSGGNDITQTQYYQETYGSGGSDSGSTSGTGNDGSSAGEGVANSMIASGQDGGSTDDLTSGSYDAAPDSDPSITNSTSLTDVSGSGLAGRFLAQSHEGDSAIDNAGTKGQYDDDVVASNYYQTEYGPNRTTDPNADPADSSDSD